MRMLIKFGKPSNNILTRKRREHGEFVNTLEKYSGPVFQRWCVLPMGILNLFERRSLK